MTDKYTIRRAILKAMLEFGNPQTVKILAIHHTFSSIFRHVNITDEDRQDIRVEWDYLLDKGYLQPVPEFTDYCRLAPDLRNQLEEQERNPTLPNPLRYDPRLYGPDALR